MVSKQEAQPGQAIPFIEIDSQEGQFTVTSAAMMFLESLPRNMKVAIVSIAGPYRTGKSFLANRILGQSKGFEIGSTTQACTKGIWMWNQPIQLTADTIMLLIDTEGLASTERSTNVDIKIFSLSILLSSMFIYNQMGPITEHALEELSLVANLTNYIRIQQSQQKESGMDYKQYFPQFYWVLRDFYHDLEGQTPKQYLEDCLQPQPGLSKEVLKKNQIRESIQKYFKDRECFTLIRPVTDESKLAHVDDMKFEELKLDFRKQVTSLVGQVKKRIKAKMISSKVLNATMFLQLALEYTESLNQKETPTVLTAIDRVVQAEANKIHDSFYEKFNNDLESQINEDTLPMEGAVLSKIVRQVTKSNKQELQKELATVLNFSEIVEETQKFMGRIGEIVKNKMEQNYSASYHFEIGLLQKLYQTVASPFGESGQNQQFDSVFVHEYTRKWTTLLKEFKDNGKSVIQFEVFAESLVPQQENRSLFVNRELVEFEQEATSMMGDDDLSTQYSSQQNFKSSRQENYALLIFEKVIDQVTDLLNEQLNKLKIQLTEIQTKEKKFNQQKKLNDQTIELGASQNEDIKNLNNEQEMKIETLKRELVSRNQEIESLKQVRDMEIKNVKRNHDRQLKEKDEDLKQVESQQLNLDQLLSASSAKVQELESEKLKEVGSISNDIKKLEEDIEGLKTKMKNKENNPHYIQVNNFFGEVKSYIEQYKDIFNQVEDSKAQKMKLFSLQKQLNDLDYKANQNELQLKRDLDEKLRQKKEELEFSYEQQVVAMEQERNMITILNEKKAQKEAQLGQVISRIEEVKERQMNLQDSKDNSGRAVQIKQNKILQIQNDIKEMKDAQIQLEDKIYSISIENKQKQEDKEIMLFLIPQIYKAIQGKQNNIKGFLGQMENDMYRNKIMKILQNSKIPYK